MFFPEKAIFVLHIPNVRDKKFPNVRDFGVKVFFVNLQNNKCKKNEG